MVNLNVNLNGSDYVLSLPTMFSEVNPEFLKTLVDNIDVAPDYSLVAIIYKEKPIAIIDSIKRNKNATVAGIATSLGLGTYQINSGLKFLFNVPETNEEFMEYVF